MLENLKIEDLKSALRSSFQSSSFKFPRTDTAYTSSPMIPGPPNPSRWRTPWGLLIFLLGYVVLLVVVSRYYLLPALEVVHKATPTERKWLSASSALLLAVVLFIIAVGIVLTFRVSRFFFPRPSAAREKPTQYVDAWSESAKRMRDIVVEDEDEGEAPDDAI
jgi:hypothetical protein